MKTLLQELLSNGAVVTDGAWGTQFQSLGLGNGEAPDRWNLIYPERVREVAASYINAGSQIILTNTFGANRFILSRHGLGDQVTEINRAGAQISCKAAQGKARVFGSIGPSGKMLMMGEVSESDLFNAFSEQASALADGGAEGLVVETMSDLEEARLAVSAAAKTGLPIVACMAYDSGKDKDRTMMGITPEQAANQLAEAGADVIGANCGQGIESVLRLCRQLKAATDKPIWIKPNAGMPELHHGQAVYSQSPSVFASYVNNLIKEGANFIGGCCGTSPEHIIEIKKALG